MVLTRSMEVAKDDNELSVENPCSDTLSLLQPPGKWTARHLSIAQVQKRNVLVDGIIDTKYLPSDEDPDFKHLVHLLCDPDMEDFLGDSSRSEIDLFKCEKPFARFFGALRNVKRGSITEKAFASKNFLSHFDRILGLTRSNQNLMARSLTRFPIVTPLLKSKKLLWVDGCIVRCSKRNNSIGMPLAIISIIRKESEDNLLAKQVIPYLLLQANMAYNHDPNLENYPAFIIGIDEFTITFTRADISPEYIKSIRAGHPIPERLSIYCSEAYDISDQATRKEFLRLTIGLDRYFHQRPEFSFPLERLKHGIF